MREYHRIVAFHLISLESRGPSGYTEFPFLRLDSTHSIGYRSMSGPIRAVFFDLDQTLADDRSSASQAWDQTFRYLLQFDSRLPRAELETVYWRMSNDIWSVIDEHLPEGASARALWLEVWPEALRRVGCTAWKKLGPLAAQRYSERRITTYELYPDTVPVLDQIRPAAAVIVVTNGTCDIQEAKIEKVGLRDHVDAVVIAQAVGASKPSPRIYQRALELADCLPQEALMVGDDYARDVVGALQCGLRAIWMHRDGDGPEPPYPPFPESVIHDLCPLVSLLPVGAT